MSKNKKCGPRPYKRNAVILQLRDCKKATSAELTVATAYLDALVQAGIVRIIERSKKAGRGRPSNVYALSAQGNGKASAIIRKQKAIAP